VLDLSRSESSELETAAEAPKLSIEEQVGEAFGSLPNRYDSDRMDRPLSWYFSLGDVKYSVAITLEGCTVNPGRPQGGSADCVIKATPDMIRRLICESYVPTPAEFVSGVIKTNDIPLLIEFSRVFDLTDFEG
jgi:long-chain acyl-CoA synthetase